MRESRALDLISNIAVSFMTDIAEHTQIKPKRLVHFDEFVMFLESAERTTDRRLELNKSNASISLLILAGVGAILSWSFGKDPALPYALVFVVGIAYLARKFCISWLEQIKSYKDLNTAKFTVLAEMAKNISLTSPNGDQIHSAEPFEKEWQILKENEALKPRKSGMVLKSSEYETFVPTAFARAFGILMAFAVLYFVLAGCHDTLYLQVQAFSHSGVSAWHESPN